MKLVTLALQIDTLTVLDDGSVSISSAKPFATTVILSPEFAAQHTLKRHGVYSEYDDGSATYANSGKH